MNCMGTKKWYRLGFIFLLLVIVLAGCGINLPSAEDPPKQTNTSTPEQTPGTAEPGQKESPIVTTTPSEVQAVTETRITLAAIGDVLIHSSIWKDAYKEGNYDFKAMFQQIKPYLEQADVTFANQESMIGGTELGLSSYPLFNSPQEVGDTLKDSGIDIVSMANNHSLDAKEEGLLRAIEHWNKLGIPYVGANKDPQDMERVRILEMNGIRIAFLAYTYGTNGIPIPDGKPYLVNLLNEERLKADLAKAKAGADMVAVSMHFGTEYAAEPDEVQMGWAQLAADYGADLIIGHHPHVLQPVEWLERASGGRTLVIYSLGNFIAAQEQAYPNRQIGGIAYVDIIKTVTDEGITVALEKPRILPTYIKFRNWRGYEVIPLDQVTDEQLPQADKHIQATHDILTKRMKELQILSSTDKW